MSNAPAPTPDHARVRGVFLAACDLAPTELAAFLADTCADDAALRREVESLLAHDDATGDLLSEGRVGAASRFHLGTEVDPPTPERIGHFRILRRIGAGGMGEVFEAQQASPNRRVALKALHPGTVSRSMLRRFQQESETQARLNHPAIAAVYETGIDTSHGAPRPWFAMELVEGESLAAFCEKHALPRRTVSH